MTSTSPSARWRPRTARKPHHCRQCQRVGGDVLMPTPAIQPGDEYVEIEERDGEGGWRSRARVCGACWSVLPTSFVRGLQ